MVPLNLHWFLNNSDKSLQPNELRRRKSNALSPQYILKRAVIISVCDEWNCIKGNRYVLNLNCGLAVCIWVVCSTCLGLEADRAWCWIYFDVNPVIIDFRLLVLESSIETTKEFNWETLQDFKFHQRCASQLFKTVVMYTTKIHLDDITEFAQRAATHSGGYFFRITVFLIISCKMWMF